MPRATSSKNRNRIRSGDPRLSTARVSALPRAVSSWTHGQYGGAPRSGRHAAQTPPIPLARSRSPADLAGQPRLADARLTTYEREEAATAGDGAHRRRTQLVNLRVAPREHLRTLAPSRRRWIRPRYKSDHRPLSSAMRPLLSRIGAGDQAENPAGLAPMPHDVGATTRHLTDFLQQMRDRRVPLRGTIAASRLRGVRRASRDLYSDHAELGAEDEPAMDPVAAELLLGWLARGDGRCGGSLSAEPCSGPSTSTSASRRRGQLRSVARRRRARTALRLRRTVDPGTGPSGTRRSACCGRRASCPTPTPSRRSSPRAGRPQLGRRARSSSAGRTHGRLQLSGPEETWDRAHQMLTLGSSGGRRRPASGSSSCRCCPSARQGRRSGRRRTRATRRVPRSPGRC